MVQKWEAGKGCAWQHPKYEDLLSICPRILAQCPKPLALTQGGSSVKLGGTIAMGAPHGSPSKRSTFAS
eukprot:1140421-Pelagomonas_calceolata.AAC.2